MTKAEAPAYRFTRSAAKNSLAQGHGLMQLAPNPPTGQGTIEPGKNILDRMQSVLALNLAIGDIDHIDHGFQTPAMTNLIPSKPPRLLHD